MARDPSKGGTFAQSAADGEWYALPDGWKLNATARPPYYFDSLQEQNAKQFTIEAHCDGFFIRVLNDGKLVVLPGAEKAGPQIGPFPDFFSALLRVRELKH